MEDKKVSIKAEQLLKQNKSNKVINYYGLAEQARLFFRM